MPPRPGRLCDLLHIVYGSADDLNPGAPYALRNMLRDELLKENIDGEALQWAADRIRARPESNKRILVISDGAPVDDSTFYYNNGRILENHLIETIPSIEEEGDIGLSAIGLEFHTDYFYDRSLFVGGFDTMESDLMPFVQAMICDGQTERTDFSRQD